MARKIAIGLVAAVLVLTVAAFFWARSVLTRDAVRTALASQISSAIGQPVSIDRISASIFPRVTVNLGGVSIGNPARIRAETLRLGTDVRALLSRRIEHGTIHLDGARVELPLPAFGAATGSTPAQGGGGSPVEIVSIDAIVLNNVEVASGGRTLRGDIEVVPHGTGATLRKMSLAAEDASFTGTGEIRSLAGPVGEITLTAKTLNLARLLDFLGTFSSQAGMAGQTAPRAANAPSPNLTLLLSAERATMGALALESLHGRARVVRENVTLDPIEFGLFGGGCKGTMVLTPEATPTFRLNAALSNMDVAAITTFVGSPGVLSGRLTGRVDLGGQGADPAGIMNSAHGTARVDIRKGVMKGLGLVKTIVVATSMRADAGTPSVGRSSDEPFSQLGATLTLANGVARTSDLQFQSADVLLNAAGSLRLHGGAIDLRGNVLLSEALTKQAGRDFVRYTQEHGRVTLPATVTGTVQAPTVRIDVGSLAGRALRNAATDELGKRLKSLFPR